MGNKTYKINGTELTLKEKYSFSEWAEILEILRRSEDENESEMFFHLIKSGDIARLVSIITGEVIEELYDSDAKEIGRLITDFFSRKEGLISVSQKSSKN